MIPELNTVISVSSVLMLALTNNNSKAELRASKHSQPRSPGPLGNSEHIKYFNPDPSIVTSGLCSYKYITNRVPNRIPESLTEIYCDNPGASCNGTKFFTCQQDKTRLEVAFVERRGEAEEVRVRSVRNITVNIGCSCVTSKLRIFKHIASGPEE